MQISSRMGKKSRFSSASAPANVVRDVSVLWPLNAVSVISPKAHPKRDILHRVCLIKFAPNKCNAMCDVRASNASVRTDTINPLFSLFLTFPSSFCPSELSTMNEIFLCRPLCSGYGWLLTIDVSQQTISDIFRSFVSYFPWTYIDLSRSPVHPFTSIRVCSLRQVNVVKSARSFLFVVLCSTSAFIHSLHSYQHVKKFAREAIVSEWMRRYTARDVVRAHTARGAKFTRIKGRNQDAK